jgi:hypothetical protein
MLAVVDLTKRYSGIPLLARSVSRSAWQVLGYLGLMVQANTTVKMLTDCWFSQVTSISRTRHSDQSSNTRARWAMFPKMLRYNYLTDEIISNWSPAAWLAPKVLNHQIDDFSVVLLQKAGTSSFVLLERHAPGVYLAAPT